MNAVQNVVGQASSLSSSSSILEIWKKLDSMNWTGKMPVPPPQALAPISL
jgi:hypothetical protein